MTNKLDSKWDARFLDLAKQVASFSKDPSTQVGAVLVNDERHVVAMGYNGLAAGVNDSWERYHNRELKYKMIVHAEVNAIIQAGHAARGCTLYVWPAFGAPNICHDCAKFAIQAGIKEVVGGPVGIPKPTWAASLELAGTMLKEAGVTWRTA